ncbi:MAG TPA: Ig-like domain-containing protein, partial [Longimicrobium sp.]
TATITAITEGQTASARITVLPVPVARVTIAPDTATLIVGASLPLTVSALDAAGNLLPGRAATLVSSNAAVATLDGSRVTAVAPGTVTITATVEGRTATATITVARVPIATLGIDPASATVIAGRTLQLAIVARDAAGNALVGRAITISTSDIAIAGVNAAAQVTGVAPGVATITAAAEGRTATSTITVIPVPIASLAISPDSASITVGQQLALAVTARDEGGAILGGRPVTLATSDGSVATVSSAGTVRGVGVGVATITATAEGKTATAKVVVRPAAVESVTISPVSASLAIGATRDFAAVARDAAGSVLTGRAVAWSTANPEIATVSANGTVTAQGLGTTVLTAMVEGRQGQATVTVVAPAGGDTQAPLLTGMTFTPNAVDVTTGSRTVDFTFTATDTGTGVQGIDVYLNAPRDAFGNMPPGRSCYASSLSAGTRTNGTFRCTVTIPQGSASGQWSVGLLYASDAIGNRRSYDEEALAAAGYATKLQVTSVSDTQAPTLTGMSFTPNAVDVTTGSRTVDFTFTATDAGTGVQGIDVYLNPPRDAFGNMPPGRSCYASSLSAGTRANGTFRCTVTIPQGSASGQWSVALLYASDAIGNRRSYDEETLAAAGYATKLQVTSVSDTQAPTLTGMSFTPSSVNVGAAAGTIDFTFTATDAGTGVQGIDVYLSGPRDALGNTPQTRSCYASSLSAGTRANGTFRCTVTIPQGSASGQWSVGLLYTSDAIGNRRSYSEETLSAAGYATKIQVAN